MDIRLSAHGAYHHQYHLIWIPKYRRRVLKGDLKDFLAKRMGEIQEFHPEVEVEQVSFQVDNVHLVAVIPPKSAVSAIVGKIKANTSREIRQRVPGIKKVYWRNEFWSVGFFSRYVDSGEGRQRTTEAPTALRVLIPSATGVSPWVSTYAEHVRQLGGVSPLPNRMEVKG